jgi:hypothetical protein
VVRQVIDLLRHFALQCEIGGHNGRKGSLYFEFNAKAAPTREVTASASMPSLTAKPADTLQWSR